MKQKIPIPSLYSLLPLLVVLVFMVLPHSVKPDTTQPSPPPTTGYTSKTTSPSKAVLAVTNQALTSKVSSKKAMAVILNAPKQAAVIQSVHTQYTYRIFGSTNDPLAMTDWSLTADDAPAAWNTTTGSARQTIVAVIDTGFGLNQEDLTSQWYVNPGETGMTKPGDKCWTGTPENKATNNCDDDDNGYVDDWRGWNFVQADNNPQAGLINPTGKGVGHGTEVAGFVGATGNNGLGSTAIDQNTRIMPLTALDDDGTGYTSDIVAAIDYAVDNGANVINMSLGTYSNDPTLKAAIDYATSHNVVVVAAAGNCGDNTQTNCPPTVGEIGYPGAYPDVIAVGATDQSGARASFSSYGQELDVSAPGYDLPVSTSWSSANKTSLYASDLYGTSFSSPQVASLAALIKSIRPGSSIDDITAIIDGTASKPSGMNGLPYTEQFGHGIIDASAALNVAEALNKSSNVPTLLQTGGPVAEHVLTSDTGMASGCVATIGDACTIEMTNDDGYTRYLPYSIVSSSSVGWFWDSNTIESGNWSIRARDGNNVSTTPYLMFRKY